MANMLFANIPTDGSGGRPLEADLYGAEQQGVDAENISATGNLNIGNVVDYDAHAQRQSSGGIATEDAPASTTPSEEMMPDGLITNNGSQGRSVNYTGDTYNTTSSAAPENTPAAQSGLTSAAAAAPAAAPAAGTNGRDGVSLPSSGGGDDVSYATASSSTSTVDSHNDSHNVTNSNNTTINNYDQNYSYTQNNYSLINTNHFSDSHNVNILTLGDVLNQTINNNGGGGNGGGLINITTINNELNVLNNIITNNNGGGGGENQIAVIIQNTLNQVTNLIQGGDCGCNVLVPVIHEALTQVNQALETTVNSPVLTGLTGDVNQLLTQVTNVLNGGGDVNVNDLLSTLSTTVNQALEGLGGNDVLANVIGEVGDVLTQIVNVLGQDGGAPPLDVVGGLLDHVVSEVNHILAGGNDAGNVLNGILQNVEGDVNSLGGQLTGTLDQTVQGVVHEVNGVLGAVTTDAAPAVGNILGTVEQVVNNVIGGVNGAPDVLNSVLQNVGGDANGIGGQLGGVLNQTLQDVGHDANGILGAVNDVLAGGGNGVPAIGGVLENAPDLSAGLDHLFNNGHPLIDVEGGILTTPLATADDHALINADVGLLAHTDSAPHAAGIGLVDADLSLLNTPAAGSEAHDGLAATVNLAPVTDILAPNAGLPNIAIDIPLPAIAPSVPLASSTIDLLHQVVNDVTSHTDTLLDHANVLADSGHGGGAVDGGVLFSGGHASGSGDAGGGATISLPVIQLDHLPHIALGHH